MVEYTTGLDKPENVVRNEGDLPQNLLSTLNYPEGYIDKMRCNYPGKSDEEIIAALKRQKDYPIRFWHMHEGISRELIKQYLLLDEFGWDTTKRTVDTLETHEFNLVNLTPELQEKTYWGYRGDRKIVSHLINKEDYPSKNETTKLTVVGNWDKDNGSESNEPYFRIFTAYWGDGSSRKEIKDGSTNFDDMEYRMNHALIPEENEKITKANPPLRVDKYYKKFGKK